MFFIRPELIQHFSESSSSASPSSSSSTSSSTSHQLQNPTPLLEAKMLTPRASPNPTQKTDQQKNFRCFSHQSSFESLKMLKPAKKPVRAPKIWLTMLTPMSC